MIKNVAIIFKARMVAHTPLIALANGSKSLQNFWLVYNSFMTLFKFAHGCFIIRSWLFYNPLRSWLLIRSAHGCLKNGDHAGSRTSPVLAGSL